MDNPPVCEQLWQLSQASVRGKAHVDGGLPNQDSVFVATSAAGDVVCAAVSDGAGTAARSQEGSQEAARAVAECLCAAGERLKHVALDTEAVRSELVAGILALRGRLQEKGELRDFHCTLVAWLFTRSRSFVAQVGDSVALSTRFGMVDEVDGRYLDFFPGNGHILHRADRGEYSNETHFLTEDDWENHLRVTELPGDQDAVVLMTDGAMDVAVLRSEVFRGFLSNLVSKLLATAGRAERNRVIHAWLDDPQTYRVTGDDKTLFVAIRSKPRALEGVSIFLGQRRPAESCADTTPAAAILEPPQPAAPVPLAPLLPPVAVPVRPAGATLTYLETAAEAEAATVALATAERRRTKVTDVPAGTPWMPSAMSARGDGRLGGVLRILAAAGLLVFLMRDVDPGFLAPQDRRSVVADPRQATARGPASPDADRILLALEARALARGAQRPAAQPAAPSGAALAGIPAVMVTSQPQFRDGRTHVTVTALDAGLEIAALRPDPQISLEDSAPHGCRRGQHLRARQECQVVAVLRPLTEPGEYGVWLEIRDESGVTTWAERLVFEAVASPPHERRGR